MMSKPTDYKEYYKQLPDILAQKHTGLKFENHCYLRIALDNAIGTKWDTRIARPAYKNLSTEQRALVIQYLKQYLDDKELLQAHNSISLAYRGKLT